MNFEAGIDDILGCIEFVRMGKKGDCGNVACVFDIETSSFYQNENKCCTMYAWVFGIGGKCIRGRTWKEFLEVIDKVVAHYNLNLEHRLIVYVHNLAFEFQFMCHYFEWEKVFASEERKPIYALATCGIEFRCSYILSGYSLAKVGEHLSKYKVAKKVGDLDYKLMRHSKTPLTDIEWGYILNDGLVVMCHIQEEIERLGSIKNIPLTNTGYVRAHCRNYCLKGKNKFQYARMIKSLKLSPSIYSELKRAFMGGFTHANANYVDEVIENVHSYDFTSAYPTVMMSEKFPMSSPFKVKIKDGEDFLHKLHAYCCLFDCRFTNIRSKVSYENYISLSRCVAEHYILNNGRIVEADTLTMTMTEQDFFIIESLYNYDSIEVSNFYCFYKDYLPKALVECVLDFYEKKTTLKDVPEYEVEYMKSKNMLNSCYGMSVTDICRDTLSFANGEWTCELADKEVEINNYNKSPTRFLYFAWGIWVTAYNRRNLFTGINEFKDDYIYSDTDSLKVLNIEKHQKYIDDYNEKIRLKVKACLTSLGINPERAKPKTIKGVTKEIGVWDYEGCYSRFKTLGAKRYMTEKNGKISITIAGVSKGAGIEYLKYKYKTNDAIFKAFQEDLYFPATYVDNGIEKNGSGKLCHTYIDLPMNGILTDYLGVKCEFHELSGVHLENTDYSLSLDDDFVKLVLGYKLSHHYNL